MIKRFQFPLGALLAAAVFWPSSASACSCAAARPFEEVLAESDTVIRAEVVDYLGYEAWLSQSRPPLAMTVEVLEQVKGEVEAKRIVIWGDNGMQCRPYLNQFPIGTEWLLAVGPDYWTKPGEWAISSCGDHWKRLSPVKRKVMGWSFYRVFLDSLRR